jgi:hypothetical protein
VNAGLKFVGLTEILLDVARFGYGTTKELLMRKPVQGEKLIAADGTVYLVESVNAVEDDDEAIADIDPDFYLVEICALEDAEDMNAMGMELSNTEFEDFCKSEGISFA